MMHVFSLLLGRYFAAFGAGLIVLGVLASCTQTQGARCIALVDQSTQSRLLEVMRSIIEVKRKADGFHYTLEQHVGRNAVSYNDCGSAYQIGFTPNGGVVGAEHINDKVTYVIYSRD